MNDVDNDGDGDDVVMMLTMIVSYTMSYSIKINDAYIAYILETV